MDAETIAATQGVSAAQHARPGGPQGEPATGADKLMKAAEKGELSKEQIREAAQKYEGFFVGKMLNIMFKTIPDNKMMSGGPGEKQFRDLMVNQYGKEVAQNGGLGLADQITEQLVNVQERAQEGTL